MNTKQNISEELEKVTEFLIYRETTQLLIRIQVTIIIFDKIDLDSIQSYYQ